MTLDEAIKHCEEVAEEKERKAKVLNGDFYQSRRNECLKCAEEHRQLGEWLKDYKRLLEQEHCENAVVTHKSLCDSCTTQGCIFQSGIVRNHCDFYKAESEGTDANSN